MPIYPALALLLGCGVAANDDSIRVGARVISVVAACAALAICWILVSVRGLPSPGDISTALTQNSGAYTLSLGHMHDLTLRSFAYLRIPLVIAGLAFLIGGHMSVSASGQGMRIFIFKSDASPDLRAFGGDLAGSRFRLTALQFEPVFGPISIDSGSF